MDQDRRLEGAVSGPVVLLAIASCGGVSVSNAVETSNSFAEALISHSRSAEIAAQQDSYAPLLGVWNVEARDRTEAGTFQVSRTGEGQLADGTWRLEAEFFGRRRP